MGINKINTRLSICYQNDVPRLIIPPETDEINAGILIVCYEFLHVDKKKLLSDRHL